MAYESIYKGSKSSLEPSYKSIAPGILGGTTSIQTANQIQETSNLLNTGMKNVEISMVDPAVFDMIPKEQFKEINRLSKLTGSETSFHAPVQGVEASGFDERGGWSEHKRQEMERQIADAMIRVHDLNPDGGMPVTVHASSMLPGEERVPIGKNGIEKKDLTKGEKKYEDEGSVPVGNIYIHQETGKITASFKREPKFTTEHPEGKIYTPEEQLIELNENYWKDKLAQLEYYKERGSNVLSHVSPTIDPLIHDAGGIEKFKDKIMSNPEKYSNELTLYGQLTSAEINLKNTQRMLDEAYNEASKLARDEGNEKAIAALKQLSDKYSNDIKNFSTNKGDHNKFDYALQGFITGMNNIASTKGLTPAVYKPVEEFAIDKASQTFANVALASYKKLKDTSPMLTIENPPYGVAMSDARNLKALIKQSRKKLATSLVNEGLSQGQAEKKAEMLIGATWDTSHSSMMRKQGFSADDLKKQADIIAPYVKHVHLNDNLGFSHTDLAPGMGDVPLKDIMANFKDKGFKGKAIFEGGAFFQHFKTSPHPYVLKNMDSPIYSSGGGGSWANVYGRMGEYSSGYGPFLPEQHHSLYGAGFSGLPQELGGQISNKNSRFSGTPME